MKNKILVLIRLFTSFPSHILNWINFAKSGSVNNVAIYTFGELNYKDFPFILKKETEIINRMDKYFLKKHPQYIPYSKEKIEYKITEFKKYEK